MDIGFYSFSEPFKPGIDFYTPDEAKEISVSISITSSLNANFTMPIRAALSAESNIAITSIKIAYASAILDIDGATLTLTEGIRIASTALSGSVDLAVTIYKDAFASASISSNTTVNTNITKEAYAASVISANSNVVTNITKEAFTSLAISSNSNVVALATPLRISSSALSAESNVTTNITKIALASVSIEASITSFVTIAQEILKAQVAIDISSNVVATMTKDSFAASIISPSSTVTTIARKIKFASSTINSNVNLTVLGKIVLLTAKINQLFNNTTITVQTIKFSNTIVAYGETTTVDFSSIRSLLMLDGVPLTNQNRKLDVSAAPIFIENLNWQGDASRYYKNASANSAAKRTFNLQWTFIPNFENKTVDLRASRNFLNKKSKDGDVHTLTILKQDEDGTTPYTEESVDVLIVNYSENLIRRDLVDDVYYFDCSMSLQEV